MLTREYQPNKKNYISQYMLVWWTHYFPCCQPLYPYSEISRCSYSCPYRLQAYIMPSNSVAMSSICKM